MSTDLLFAEFDRLSEGTEAIAGLRRLILDLAVRGRLIPHADSPERPTPAQPAAPWAIPHEWRFVPLAELAGPTGLFTDGDWVESKDQDPDGDVRLTQLADVGVGVFRDRSARFMTSQVAARLNCTYLKPGDVLIARMPDPIGRACIYPGAPMPAVTVVDVAILRSALPDIDSEYVVHAINSSSFGSLVAAHIAGTTRQRISRGNLSKLDFPLPPLGHQERTVATVDELLSCCDQLEAAQAARKDLRTKLLKSVLHAALG